MFSLSNSFFKRALLPDLLRVLLLNSLLALAAPLALAQTLTVQNAWVRPTVPGQTASGAYMTLTASTPAHLKSASTPAATLTELHAMRMEGDIMKMSHLADGLELPVGKPVQLQPGGYHLMLLDLKVATEKRQHYCADAGVGGWPGGGAENGGAGGGGGIGAVRVCG